ncbi:beta-glucosidase [Candidatus Soleaferrea massiliensis]|uniref:beta-glucosidase n=1 Tax=Candidatus Soleaferrea massiliensis TaxID=1470354 RepID=UPI0005908E9C|nr:glycoside hydrolase family 3 C-terminal domain-containing protein [Candidatus Soleaferrea massiliensis]
MNAKKKLSKRILCAVMASAMVFSMFTCLPASASELSDYIHNDGYGNLTADFPEEYPSDFLVIESDTVIEQKIDALMKTLTDEEKFEMLSADGIMGWDTSAMDIERPYGTGYWKGVARLGIPVIRMYDGPMGVKGNAGYETTRPSSEISVASSFDNELAYEYGVLYGAENKANSGNNQLGDQNDIVRQLSTSRARDMFGEDWYLSGKISSAVTQGMQSENTMATLKHFGGIGNVDEQTLYENYLSSTEMAIKEGGASAIMTNYGNVNGVSACADTYLLRTVLRELWGYDGLVMTDWGGNYEFTVDNGVTMETPNGTHNNADAIKKNLEDGTITMDDVNTAVRANLRALGEVGYLYMVQVSRDGTAAADVNPPDTIELPDVLVGEAREALLNKNNEKAIELAEKGAVLVKNENETLPLSSNENIAMIGLGSTHLVAGHMHECSFGSLRGLSVSPYDALSEIFSDANVKSYVAQDIVGEAVPSDVLYQDADTTEQGVIRTGTDGYGAENNGVDANINFVTNSLDYVNAEDGNAFPYGEQGANYTWTTYLKAPESGTYTLDVQAIAAPSISATIEIDGEEKNVSSAGGSLEIGTYASTNIVSTDTGLDIPKAGGGGGGFPGGSSKPSASNSFTLEAGKTYKITVSANGNYAENYSYQAGIKDMQVRLAWITPSQKENNYNDAIAAAGAEGTSVVLFAHSTESLTLDSDQTQLLNESIAAAKAAGNKVTLVLNTALPVDISAWVDDVDAILEMWLPGQGGGTAVANLLSGKTNPSGKLSVTWPNDFSADQSEIATNGRGNVGASTGPFVTKSEIKEGIFNGYKWYDAADKQDKVLYDFGYGLSYTDFDYELVGVEPSTTGVDEYGYDFKVKVTNNGTASGSDAPQIYIGAADLENGVYSPYDVSDSWRYSFSDGADETNVLEADYFPLIDGVQQAKYQLVGYERTGILDAGESETVTIHVSQRALSYWNVDLDEYYVRSDGTKDKYTVIEGDRNFYVGKSSDNFVETKVVNVSKEGGEEPDPDTQVNKKLLESAINYAKDRQKDADYKYVIEDVRKGFEASLAAAETVYADKNATKEEVFDAWTDLVKWIHGLGLQSGDKTLLLDAITAAGTYNLDNYVENGKQEFKDALSAAQELYEEDFATQTEIDDATDRLMNAILELRLKANKSNLDALLKQAKSKDLSLYTAASVQMLRTAIADAEDVMAADLSVDDQSKVAVQEIELQKALNNLELISDNGGDDSNTSKDPVNPDDSKPDDNQTDNSSKKPSSNVAGTGDVSTGSTAAGNKKKNVNTGDTTPIAAVLSLIAVGGLTAVLAKKRRKEQ